MSLQSKLQRRVGSYQRKIYDLHIDHVGQEVSLVRVEITEDKYGDRDFAITATEKFSAYISYPGGEVPITSGVDNTDTSSLNIALYDILPIELFCKHTTVLKVGDILYQKLLTNPNLETTDSDAFRLLSLQVVDQKSKFTGTDLVWTKYIVAPYTLNYDADSMTALETTIDEILAEDWIEE